MGVITGLKARFLPNGSLRRALKQLKEIRKEYPSSPLLEETISIVRKAMYTPYSAALISQYLQKLLLSNVDEDGIVTIDGLKFKTLENFIFCGEYIDIFSSDTDIQNNYSFNKEFHKVLSAFKDEGPYQIDSVFLEENEVVVDAGSNLGIFALFAAKHKKCKVYAFEPNSEILPVLNKNISINNLNELITPVPFGLSHSDYSTNFFVNNNNIGGATILPSKTFVEKKDEMTITCVSLDNWVKKNKIPRIDFIKADIEGAERFLLQGATEVLREMQPKLAICTYHLSDDPQVLEKIVKNANPNYVIIHFGKKMYGYVNKDK
ncbi:MAG: FkbM family methyltransferase [Prevotellaceae bacterium]|jgi:FkbM family methyltransferase|nr:FkbM family methyltransferase [Prevotellaceae bacterium]